MLSNILTGGFLKGYRSYIIGSLIAIQAVAAWLVGDTTLVGLIEQAPEILAGLGLNALRASVNSVKQ